MQRKMMMNDRVYICYRQHKPTMLHISHQYAACAVQGTMTCAHMLHPQEA